MQDWIINVMNQFGYFGIAFLIAVENIFPPIPSEVILTFGGFMTTYSDFKAWEVIVFATIGSLIGAIILYSVGRLLSEEHLGKILDGKVGRILHFRKVDLHRATSWFNRKGKITVLFCRCIPVLRSLISIPAGMAKMKIGLFLLYTTIGSLVWNTLLVNLGVAAGESWENIVTGTNTYATITIFILIIIAVILFGVFINKRFIKK
jgi:membrane protein DedA with SNARE-associated domain